MVRPVLHAVCRGFHRALGLEPRLVVCFAVPLQASKLYVSLSQHSVRPKDFAPVDTEAMAPPAAPTAPAGKGAPGAKGATPAKPAPAASTPAKGAPPAKGKGAVDTAPPPPVAPVIPDEPPTRAEQDVLVLATYCLARIAAARLLHRALAEQAVNALWLMCRRTPPPTVTATAVAGAAPAAAAAAPPAGAGAGACLTLFRCVFFKIENTDHQRL